MCSDVNSSHQIIKKRPKVNVIAEASSGMYTGMLQVSTIWKFVTMKHSNCFQAVL